MRFTAGMTESRAVPPRRSNATRISSACFALRPLVRISLIMFSRFLVLLSGHFGLERSFGKARLRYPESSERLRMQSANPIILLFLEQVLNLQWMHVLGEFVQLL